MMKNFYRILSLLLLYTSWQQATAQSMHFSQYYNAPLLLNPANTALMPDNDYRIGLNYRNQWSSLPVPYNTFDAFADFKVAGNQATNNNWLGLGAAVFNDRAGDGDLSLTRFEGFAAYHLKLSDKSMLSGGLSGGYVQRSVNYDNLSFDEQWDGYTFNKTLSNQEKSGIAHTNYFTVGAGLNYAYSPNENLYIQLGGAVANLNMPKESFYNANNQVGIRPTANIDVLIGVNPALIINPSAYYTTQNGAYELVYGSLFRIRLMGEDRSGTQLILGGYNRLNESVIGVIGFQWGGLQLIASYDGTISSLAPYNNTNGALEFSLIYQGLYGGSGGRGRRTYNCPRFF